MEALTGTNIPLLDLKAQHTTIREQVLEALTRVVDAQHFILGEEVERLEAEVAAYSECQFAVGCASGSDALILPLLAAGVGPGDKVLTTPYTFFATAGAISRVGAEPIFVDVDRATYNLNPAHARDLVRQHSGIRAIIAVHLFGACADMDPLLEIGREENVLVIEDAAQAIGAEYRNRRAGSIGDVGCFSFFPSKNLGGYGDGGMITTNKEDLAKRLKALRVHGRTGKYIHEWIGINSRLDTIQAAVLRVKLRHLDNWSDRREENAEIYRNLLDPEKLPVSLPVTAPYQTRHVYNQFVIRCESRDRLQSHLKNAGIGTEVYYPLPLHLQACFSSLGYRKGDFPISEQLAQEVLALPIHPELSVADIERVCSAISEFYL